MKAVKLALIFIGFVVLIIFAIGWKQFFNHLSPERIADHTNVTSKDDVTLVHVPLESEPSSSTEYASSSSDEVEDTAYEPTVPSTQPDAEKNTPSTPQDVKERHIEEKRAMENKAITLFNAGKYKECEKLCKSEWCLNAYYVDVKNMGKILSSNDKTVQVQLKHDGIIDSDGRLTPEYQIKSVEDFAHLMKELRRFIIPSLPL